MNDRMLEILDTKTGTTRTVIHRDKDGYYVKEPNGELSYVWANMVRMDEETKSFLDQHLVDPDDVILKVEVPRTAVFVQEFNGRKFRE